MTISLHGRSIDYEEAGAVPCLLFIPGSFSTTAAWRPIGALLQDRFRLVATSLLGYGRTEECRTADRASVALEAEVVEAVAAQAAAPVHLVAHSFGGVVALSVALRGRIAIESLTLFETNDCDLLRQSGERELYDDVRRFGVDYIKAYHNGKRDDAGRVIDFWAGPGSFEALPQAMRDYAIRTTRANVLDWLSMFGFDCPITDYAAIDCPVLVVSGERSHPAARRVADVLADICPHATRAEIAGASHLVIGTHPDEAATLIAEHVGAAEQS